MYSVFRCSLRSSFPLGVLTYPVCNRHDRAARADNAAADASSAGPAQCSAKEDVDVAYVKLPVVI